jgi:hypothetical protein
MHSHLKSTFSLLQYIDIEENPVPLNDLLFIITESEITVQESVVDSVGATATHLLLNRFS